MLNANICRKCDCLSVTGKLCVNFDENDRVENVAVLSEGKIPEWCKYRGEHLLSGKDEKVFDDDVARLWKESIKKRHYD